MRTIKFRAYVKDKEFMGEVLEISLLNEYALVGLDAVGVFGGSQSFDFDELEIMQHTGLKDKNGTEIYEGDILQAEDDPEYLGYIYYSTGSLTYMLKNDYSFSLCLSTWQPEFLEVIGNIYENSDLLDIYESI